MDTVDAALAALDADDLERAESLAAELEEPSVEPSKEPGAAGPMRAAEHDEGDSTS